MPDLRVDIYFDETIQKWVGIVFEMGGQDRILLQSQDVLADVVMKAVGNFLITLWASND